MKCLANQLAAFFAAVTGNIDVRGFRHSRLRGNDEGGNLVVVHYLSIMYKLANSKECCHAHRFFC